MNIEERFWSKVDRTGGPEACWPWTASVFRGRNGYGKFQAGKSRKTARIVYAHRFAWELANGQEIPAGMFACHHCDNPICVNPSHIFIGTPADNMLDMTAKGRHWLHGRSHCKRGHPWSAENTYLRHWPDGSLRQRACRACKRLSYQRTRSAA